MPRLIFAILFACIVTASPALSADDKTIRIIREDGTVTEYQIPAGTPAPPAPPASAPSRPARPAPENVPEVATPAPAPMKVDKKMAAPVSEVVPYQPVKDQTVDDLKAEQKADKKVSPPPKKMEAESSVALSSSVLPLPGRKPSVPYRFLTDLEDAVPVMDADGFITRDSALRIALDAAPPARRFEVVPALHKGAPAYRVTFVTDDGARDIMVDARSGEILK